MDFRRMSVFVTLFHYAFEEILGIITFYPPGCKLWENAVLLNDIWLR